MPLGALLQDALAGADVAAATAEITLTATLADPAAVVRADRRRLLQVLEHVIRHALSATPTGGTVALAAEAGPRGVQLTLSAPDAVLNPGRAATELEPFSVAPEPTPPQAVLRLGLYASRIIMQAHGGALTLGCAPPGGMTTILTLPPWRVPVAAVPSTVRDWSAPPLPGKVMS